MIQTGFESRVKVQQVLENQLPEFILDESPKFLDFLKQYYISQEYQGATVDIVENLDQYLKLDNLTPEVIVGYTTLSTDITSTDETITVISTKGFPQQYGLLKIDDEIITYTGITTNTFTGCIRGFSGITSYHKELDQEELVFSTSEKKSHVSLSTVQNLSSLFLQEFYKKLKYTLTPGLENVNFVSDLNVGNFIKEAKTLYQSKGTEESFRILFNVLFGETPKIIDLEQFLIKPSSAKYIRRKIVVADVISGDPLKLVGQTITKNNDPKTTASISSVELISRKGKTYYKIGLFVGYDDEISTITGTFNITGSTKNIEQVSVGSSVITVDSTIGFPNSGKLYSGENEITYTEKSINQFFGCSGVTSEIAIASTIYSDETYYGYEDGDISSKVVIRITGVLSGFKTLTTNSPIKVGDEITVKNLGEIISNPDSEPTKKEIFANSWVYNTSSRYEIDSLDTNTQITLKSKIDKSSLKVGDYIDILERDTQTIVKSNVLVLNIILNLNQIGIGTTFTGVTGVKYDIRRNIETANSSIVPLEFNSITSNVQNVYNENDEYMYVASNSLPSYTISQNIFSYDANGVSDYDSDLELYSTITFPSLVSFRTGNRVYYTPSESPVSGLTEGFYYVEVVSNVFGNIKIKLYYSKSLIGSINSLKFGSLTSGTHNFTLDFQKEKIISPQKILRKFPLSLSAEKDVSENTTPGAVGLLVNGVEILNYKTEDKIYYGPLDSVKVLNGGSGYDVINPPLVEVGVGSALIQPVISGSIEKIIVDPQDFDIDVNVSVAITGGNGIGAAFDPVVIKKRREIEFDARRIENGGGVDITYETITFLSNHYLNNGAEVIYIPGNNSPLGIGTFQSVNPEVENTGNTLVSGSRYYVKRINDTTIQLYTSLGDYRSGINTVGFTTVGTSGIHKFATEIKNTLSEIKVLNGGSGYTNRKLRVLSSGISTAKNTIEFKNHGFNDGELVVYSGTGNLISGLTTSNQYYVIKSNSDTFRLSDAGIGGTDKTNYDRKKYVSLGSTGSGYHIFNYPNISVNVTYSSVGLGTTQTRGSIIATPIIRGQIVDTYVYNSGSDYGSTILNYHKKPSITIKNGKSAQLKPLIVGGKIEKVIVLYGGVEYYSTPDIVIIGDGIGAEFRPVVVNNKITEVKVINHGSNYTEENTSIVVKSAGKNALLDPNVRSLLVNGNILYSDILVGVGSEVIKASNNNLQYYVSGYSGVIKTEFNDTNSNTHSPIIGWAYDGYPIYGSYGYSNPENINNVGLITSGYSLNTSNVSNRPSGFPDGFFIEDYVFTNYGNLDEHNGRFCITPEFPNGTYAYFATSIQNDQGNFVGVFPYFIGNKFKTKFIEENRYLNQTFDFNGSNLVRNTFPYKIGDEYADNDFIIESNEIVNQSTVVESVTSDSITDFEVVSSGNSYKIGDTVKFDESNTNDSGLIVSVSEIIGKDVVDVQTTYTSYTDAVFTWDSGKEVKVTINPKHSLNNLDYVRISGFSTNLSGLNSFQQIGVTSYTSKLIKEIPSYASTGIVTDIYVSTIPDDISIDSDIKIGTEVFSVRGIFKNQSILRVSREVTGSAHTSTTTVNYLPNTFIINKSLDYFESKTDDLVYFNPKQSVGVGTTSGIGIAVNYTIGQTNKEISIPTQSIYLPNHPFKTNQEIIFTKPSGSSSISVANTSTSTPFNLPISGNTQTVYAIKKSPDHIGIVTQVGLTTNTDGLFFINDGDNDFEYLISSNFNKVKGNVEKINSTVSVSTSHGLSNGDLIKLKIQPNLSVGIGTSTAIKVKKDDIGYLLINPIGFNSTGVSTITNELTLPSHNLKTGDKVKYSSNLIISGLSTGFYYVYKVDNNRIKISETYYDTQLSTPTTVSFASTGGSSQNITLVNPAIDVIKNNNLVFDLTDSSLVGYELKIFTDSDFENEFISSSYSDSFTVVGVGTVGVSTNASLTINYDEKVPLKLFYGLEKSGVVEKSDKDVINYSQINFIDSYYNNTYKVSGVGTTTFEIFLSQQPERNSYYENQCDTLEYTTTSPKALGGIGKVKTVSSGKNYNALPTFISVISDSGSGAYILPKSNTIGKVNQFRIRNEGFEYSSDKTLIPQAKISNFTSIKNSNTISNILVSSGGNRYTSPPDLIIINSETREKIDSGVFVAKLTSNSITSVDITTKPKGLPEKTVEVKSINNTNGIKIQKVESSSTGIVTCTIVTPLSGFGVGPTPEPFALGDKIFVEGIEKYSSDGDGFNSENYGYEFFEITNYTNSGTNLPRKVTFSLSGFTTNPGVAKTSDNLYGTIVNYKNYPQFTVEQSFTDFIVGEKLEVKNQIGFVLQDLEVVESNKNYIRLKGTYKIEKDQIIRGTQSGSIATINEVEESYGYFSVDFAYLQRFGWIDDIGKLNEDTQVIPDNDYYQNLSYTVKSKQNWDKIVSPVNKLLHPSGLKNFADTEIIQSTKVGIGSTQQMNIFYDIVSESRVDTIKDFDLVKDVDIFDNKSKYLQFANKKLSDYLACKTNRVLDIDDISSEFSNSDNVSSFALTYDGIPIFEKTFNPNVDIVGISTFSISNHFFNTGEELIYTPGEGGTALGIGSTENYVGIVTNILPERVYAIKTSNNSFKLASKKEYANLGIAITFTSVGTGNTHKLEMVKKNEKTIISINNIIQSPISYSLINTNIDNGGQISTASTIFGLSGITSISINDILKIDNEYMKVVNVGLGTTYSGPISFAGTFPLVQVERGFVGTSVTTHSNSGIASVYRGSFNIVNSTIYFTEPPSGNIQNYSPTFITNVSTSGTIGITTNTITGISTLNIEVGQLIQSVSGLIVSGTEVTGIGTSTIYINPSSTNSVGIDTFNFNFGYFADFNLPEFNSYFNGRVFLRKDYTTNQIYDNISEQFTGVGQTYRLTVGGSNTTGLGTVGGNGIVFINGVYQTPTTENNLNNNFNILENTTLGISSIVFSGITTSNGSIFISNSDVNQNQLPRGGMIVSLGSTPGLGYAPLVGASVTAILSSGVISSIGIGTTGNWGSGYRNPVSVAVTDSVGYGAVITASVGVGGTLSFIVSSGGSGYVNPKISVPSPSYNNLSVTGVSRLGIGTTTDCGIGLLLNVDVGASSTTGIGSTLFEVTGFNIIRNGYQFRKGDVIRPVGLVTDYSLTSPISEFELTILDVYSDTFHAQQFGELDYIDSIKNYQNGFRRRFPLYYNSQLISFEQDSSDPDSQLIDFNNLLIIFLNGVLQEPKVSYEFNGGTSFTFVEPPKEEDQVDIYFYKGSSQDSEIKNVYETIKIGDDVQVFSINNNLNNTETQGLRVVSGIGSVDTIETVLYTEQGVNENINRPLYWTKQKKDRFLNGEFISKSRDSIESQIYPTAKIISNLSQTDTAVYVDNSKLFEYETGSSNNFKALIVSGSSDPVSAAVTAVVSSAGTIQSLTINSSGSGYVGASINVSIANPPASIVGFGTTLSVGTGTTATASISIVNGSLGTVTITNPGSGYTFTNPPQVLVPYPEPIFEVITDISFNDTTGGSGNIVGIATTVGIGTDLAIQFTYNSYSGDAIQTNDYIYVFDTKVGSSVTSIISSNSQIVGVGTTFVDNIYKISAITYGTSGIITCNIHSQTLTTGISTTGVAGKFSWGKFNGFVRSASPVSIAVSGYQVDSGLSTFPTIQRRDFGLRDTGALKKQF